MHCERSGRLYVVHHTEIDIPQQPMIMPFRADQSTSDNIAGKTGYCELRAQYAVWKQNEQASFVGFFHPRRYLDLSRQSPVLPGQRQRPYQIVQCPSINEEEIQRLTGWMEEYDVLAPAAEYTGVTVLERYGFSPTQRVQDIATIQDIIREQWPAVVPSANRYLLGRWEYYGNIYIMKWAQFTAYCQWLFAVLEEFDRRVPNSLPKTQGYLGERLFGIYYTLLQENAHCGELPRLHFSCYDDKTHHFERDRVINCFLPPGGKLRGTARKIVCRIKFPNKQEES